MTKNQEIRFALPEDIDALIDLCEAHSIYEKAVYERQGKRENLLRDLFTESPKLYCLVAIIDKEIVGYATYMKQYSTWDASEYIYMDCIFLREYTRGMGLGAKLIEEIAKEGRKLGCNLIQWQTPDFNTGAIRFYKRIGAVAKPKERFFLTI